MANDVKVQPFLYLYKVIKNFKLRADAQSKQNWVQIISEEDRTRLKRKGGRGGSIDFLV